MVSFYVNCHELAGLSVATSIAEVMAVTFFFFVVLFMKFWWFPYTNLSIQNLHVFKLYLILLRSLRLDIELVSLPYLATIYYY